MKKLSLIGWMAAIRGSFTATELENLASLHPDHRMIAVPERFHEDCRRRYGVEQRRGLGYALSDGVWFDPVDYVVYCCETV